MKTQTKEKLEKFINAIESLTAAITLQIGIKTASEVLTACYQLKAALKEESN